MPDIRGLALVAGITLGPGLAYMAINDLFFTPLAWVTFLGLGGGLVVIWSGGSTKRPRAEKTCNVIGSALLVTGIIAAAMLDG